MADTIEKEKVDLWRNRRAMAWRSFYGAIVYIIAIVTLFFSGKVSADLSSFLGQFSIGVFGFFGTIIAAYIGASTYHDVKLRNNQQN